MPGGTGVAWRGVMTEDAPPTAPPWGVPMFPNRYVWLVLLSSLDVFMTFLVLELGGSEANPVANFVLERAGIAGMTVFKFVLVAFVILVCEVLGRRDRAAARRLTLYALALTMTPVVFATILIATRLLVP